MKDADDCLLPEDRLYYVAYDVWFKTVGENIYKIGATQPFLFLARRPNKISIRPQGAFIKKSTAIALIVSWKMEGALVSPVDCQVLRVNEAVMKDPELLAEDPYGSGWIAEIVSYSEPVGFTDAKNASELYRRINEERGVICFKTVPHYQLTVFGETCEGILTQIGDYMSQHLRPSETLHVITADPATEVDMIKWAEETGHELVAVKRHGRLLHVVYRKRI